MVILTPAIAILMVGTAMLMMGTGLLQTLMPVRAHLESFSTVDIGLLGTAHFAGFALGCIVGPYAIKVVGHVRAFSGFAAVGAVCALAYPLLVDPYAWIGFRLLGGAALAILYMAIESWLNEASTNAIRGSVLSFYIIVSNLVTIAGQLMLNLYDPAAAALFSLVAILIALSLVPLSLTRVPEPKPIATAKLEPITLFQLSPTGVIGCLFFGLVEGSFWSLAPTFALAREFTVFEVTLFMSAFVAGGTVSQWPLGMLSDRTDRRKVIAFCCGCAVVTGLALAFVPLPGFAAHMIVALFHGAFMFPLYALLLAHANDYAPNERLVQTSSGLLLIYSCGAIAGPAVAAPLMQALGDGMLFLFIALLLGPLAAFALYRATKRGVATEEERNEFWPVPPTPLVYELETPDEE